MLGQAAKGTREDVPQKVFSAWFAHVLDSENSSTPCGGTHGAGFASEKIPYKNRSRPLTCSAHFFLSRLRLHVTMPYLQGHSAGILGCSEAW